MAVDSGSLNKMVEVVLYFKEKHFCLFSFSAANPSRGNEDQLDHLGKKAALDEG